MSHARVPREAADTQARPVLEESAVLAALKIHRDYRDIVKELKANGFEVIRARRRCHIHVLDIDGNLVAVFPATPSDHRALENTRAQLRRAGAIT